MALSLPLLSSFLKLPIVRIKDANQEVTNACVRVCAYNINSNNNNNNNNNKKKKKKKNLNLLL